MDANSIVKKMPYDTLQAIFQEAHVKDLENLTLVCRTFNSAMNEQFWNNFIPKGCLTGKFNAKLIVLCRMLEDEKHLLEKVDQFIETLTPGCNKTFNGSFFRKLDSENTEPYTDVSISTGKPTEKLQYWFRKYFKPSSSGSQYYSDYESRQNAETPDRDKEGFQQETVSHSFSVAYFNVLEMLDFPCFRNAKQEQIEEKVTAFMKELFEKIDQAHERIEQKYPDTSPELFSGLYEAELINEFPEEYDFTEKQQNFISTFYDGNRYHQCEVNAMIVPEAGELVAELKAIQNNVIPITILAEKVYAKLGNRNLKIEDFSNIF